MRKILLSIIYLTCVNYAYAQAPSIQWQRSLGGSLDDLPKSIRQTTDGGYIIVGSSKSNDGNLIINRGENDYWIVKLNPSGSLQWQKTYGGTHSDIAWEVQQTTDGGYIVAGEGGSPDGDIIGNIRGYDYWIIKLDDTGAIQWQKSIGGTNSDQAYAIKQTTDGGYIVAGTSRSNDGDVSGNHGDFDYWLVKLSSSGDIQWQKSYGGSRTDYCRSVQQTYDGGYVLAGLSRSNDSGLDNRGGYDYWIVKVNDTGAIQWQKSYGGNSYDVAWHAEQTFDSGYIIAGYTNSNEDDVSGYNGNSDVWVIKLSSIGSLDWQKCFGGTKFDVAQYIQQTLDSGFIIAATSESNNGDVSGNHGYTDDWIIKLNSSGSVQWQKCFGGSNPDGIFCIQQTTDGGFVVVGESSSNDGDVSGNHGNYDYWILKIGAASSIPSPNSKPNISIYPNPTIDNIFIKGVDNVTLKTYNILGMLIKEVSKTNNISLAEFPTGMYFIHLFNEEGEMIFVDKIIKQ